MLTISGGMYILQWIYHKAVITFIEGYEGQRLWLCTFFNVYIIIEGLCKCARWFSYGLVLIVFKAWFPYSIKCSFSVLRGIARLFLTNDIDYQVHVWYWMVVSSIVQCWTVLWIDLFTRPHKTKSWRSSQFCSQVVRKSLATSQYWERTFNTIWKPGFRIEC